MYVARERSGDGHDYTTCPVCSEMINGSAEELNEHVELCLNRVSASLVTGTLTAVERDDDSQFYANKQGWLM